MAADGNSLNFCMSVGNSDLAERVLECVASGARGHEQNAFAGAVIRRAESFHISKDRVSGFLPSRFQVRVPRLPRNVGVRWIDLILFDLV